MQKTTDMSSQPDHEKKLLVSVLKAIQSPRCGSVVITVHDSKVVQIDKIEKVGFEG